MFRSATMHTLDLFEPSSGRGLRSRSQPEDRLRKPRRCVGLLLREAHLLEIPHRSEPFMCREFTGEDDDTRGCPLRPLRAREVAEGAQGSLRGFDDGSVIEGLRDLCNAHLHRNAQGLEDLRGGDKCMLWRVWMLVSAPSPDSPKGMRQLCAHLRQSRVPVHSVFSLWPRLARKARRQGGADGHFPCSMFSGIPTVPRRTTGEVQERVSLSSAGAGSANRRGAGRREECGTTSREAACGAGTSPEARGPGQRPGERKS